jgi:hypothetical protein
VSDSVLITPRRNFLIRALGFTAAGAAMSIPIITVANAKARIDHHTAELEKAFHDYYAGLNVEVIKKLKCTPEKIQNEDRAAFVCFMAQRRDAVGPRSLVGLPPALTTSRSVAASPQRPSPASRCRLQP